MSEIIPCINCSERDNCTAFEVLNNTLDRSKKHKKLTLRLDFIVTVNEPEEFEEDWKEDISGHIAENAACLSQIIIDKVGSYNNIVQALCAHLTVSKISNKKAFTELYDYIKVTHE